MKSWIVPRSLLVGRPFSLLFSFLDVQRVALSSCLFVLFLNHLEGPRTTPREPFLNAPFTLAQTSFYVKLCLSHRFLPLIVARVDRGHVEEGRDSIELLAHLD